METTEQSHWHKILSKFNSIDVSKPNAREELLKLKEEAKITQGLTARQTNAIYGRVSHSLDILDNPNKANQKGALLSDYDLSRQNKAHKKR